MITVHTGSSQPMTRLMIVQEAVNVITGLEQQLRGMTLARLLRMTDLWWMVHARTRDGGGMLSSLLPQGVECCLCLSLPNVYKVNCACPSYIYTIVLQLCMKFFDYYYYYYYISFDFAIRV